MNVAHPSKQRKYPYACPRCGTPTEDEGLCVICYDAEVDADDSMPLCRDYLPPQTHRPEYNYDYDRDYRLAHKDQINAYKQAWRAAQSAATDLMTGGLA